ncbi:MAG: HIT domain-containing protein [Anaerolineae bacterium]|nr:HIT domain-containing protein [Anaerolineae bacterium]
METNELLVLEHPDPSYEFHLLILPRQVIRDFSEVQPDSQYWLSLPGVVSQLVQQFHLEGRGYRLITNTGQYQDIPQLHFHLVSGESLP